MSGQLVQCRTVHTLVCLISNVGLAISQSKVVLDLVLLELLWSNAAAIVLFPDCGSPGGKSVSTGSSVTLRPSRGLRTIDPALGGTGLETVVSS